MATIANLNILLNIDDRATAGLEKSRRNLEGWGRSLQNIGAGLTAGVTAPILGMAALSVKAASDLQESLSAVGEVYDEAAGTVVQRSLEAAQAVGLSQQEYLSTAAVLGVYGDTLGMTASETADFSNSLIGAAADLGSFYNANTPEVLSAMQAALRGEFDPLERFGIMMNQAALEQYALEQGIWDGTGALTAQQRILAAQGFILDNMNDATGDFARTSGGLANSQKILRAQLKNVAAQMGQVLLPTITKAVKVFGELLTRFQSISPEWQRWIVIIGLAVAAIGPFLIVLGTILTVLPAIGAALAVLTGPIGLVIAAIALLTAAYIGNWWGFRDAVNGVASSVSTLLARLNEFAVVNSVVDSAVSTITNTLDRLKNAFDKTGTGIMSGNWRAAIEGIGDVLSAPAKAIGEFVRGIETGFAPLDALLDGVGGYFVDMGRIVQEVFQGDISGALRVFLRFILRVPTTILSVFRAINWGAVGTALAAGIQSLPGYIADAGTILYDRGRELLGGVMNGISAALPAVLTLISVIGPMVLATAVGYLALLYDKGRELIGGILMGISAAIPALVLLVSVLGGMAVAAAGDFLSLLYEKGRELIGGVLNGISNAIPGMEDLIGGLGAGALTAVGDLGKTLYAPGADLIGGLMGGANSMIGYFEGLVGKIPGMAISAVGNLGSTLYNAGADLIGGLIGGINSMIGGLQSTLGRVTGWIPDWKGPAARDAMLLFGNGQLIMGGLIGGIESQAPALKRSLGSITADIDGRMSAGFTGMSAGRANGSAYGSSGGGFNNYGVYNESDRYWAPEQAQRRQTLRSSRR